MIIPLIQSSINPASEVRQYLLDDALDLWHSLVVQTPSPPSAEVTILLENLFPLYEVGSDALRRALDITEAYIYLIPAEILTNASILLLRLVDLLGSVKKTATGIITRIVELLIRSADTLGGLAAVQRLTENLVSSNFLPLLISDLKAAYDANQTTGPNRLISPIESIVESDYFSVLARIALASPDLLVTALEASGQGSTAEWLLVEWFAQMDSISNADQKKLSCFALTAFLERDESWILTNLQSYMSMWTDVIAEIVYEWADDNNNLKKVDCTVYASPKKLQPEATESAGTFRERQLNHSDPLYLIDVRDFIRGRLEAVVKRNGGLDEFRHKWVDNVDKDVVQAFSELGIF